MSLNSVILAVEDELSNAVSTKILENFGNRNCAKNPKIYIKGILTFKREPPNSTAQLRDRLIYLCSQI